MSVDTNEIYSPIFGTKLRDIIAGTNRSEVISGRRGDDDLTGDSGSDTIYGGSGDDDIRGNSGDDILYGGGGPSYVDLSSFMVQENYSGRVTFLDEGAGYRNALGMYKIADDNTIYETKILFPNASKQGSGGDLIPGESYVDVPLEAGDQIGFFIVSNGYGRGTENQNILSDETGSFVLRNVAGELGNLATDSLLELWHVNAETGVETKVKSQYGNDIFHSAADPSDNYEPNPDNYSHTVGRLNSVTGEVFLGFEDLKYGGDNDYDDTVFRFDIGASNARVLDPNIKYDDNGDEIVTTPSYDGSGNLVNEQGALIASENDELWGGSGADEIFGMAGHDVLWGEDGADQLWGNSGNDSLNGGQGNDILKGGKGNDILADGSGHDVIYGNSGDDYFIAASGNDSYIGGSGFDTIDLSAAGGNVKLDLHKHTINGLGEDTIFGIEAAIGSDYNDIFKGDKRDNEFDGGAGDDYFRGLGGNDTFTGGDGSDTFFWRTKDIKAGDNDSYVDTIIGFTTEDVIDLSELVNGSANDFDLKDWVRLDESNTGTTVSVDFNGGGDDFTSVALLSDVYNLTLESVVDNGALVY